MRDGVPMVFHDYTLPRLTGHAGPIGALSAAELHLIPLLHGDDGIPTLTEVLEIVAGQVPVLIEVKDTDVPCGPDVGTLEKAVAGCLASYTGPVAMMSFNPFSVAALALAAPHVPRGLVVGGPEDETYTGLPPARILELADAADFDEVQASFISYDRALLHRPAVLALKARGVPILCWTVRSPEQEAAARQVADNITFEGYAA